MGCWLQDRCNARWMFPNRKSLREQDPRGKWTTFSRGWNNTSMQWALRRIQLRWSFKMNLGSIFTHSMLKRRLRLSCANLRNKALFERIKELTKAITEADSFVEVGTRKDKFEFSKPKETSNSRGGYKEEHDRNVNSGNSKNGGKGKPPNGKRKPNNHPRNKENEKKPIQYFLCSDPHKVQDYP
ncbi:hypothetical protein PVK06_009279 [Gossypium arboreum]|uniref:Uncharacterized protein n=1 Tax=Gossypium arboreum TaxID=29729 RepID=A0ABR0QMI1_GOSAR|nr:hypothetical protein PVK06_009279 [Gossypium arboreum]